MNDERIRILVNDAAALEIFVMSLHPHVIRF